MPIEHSLLNSKTHLVVMGLGLSGMAAVRFGLACGAKVSVSDCGSRGSVKAKLATVDGVEIPFEAEGHTGQFLAQADVLFMSPGIAVDSRIEKLQKQGVKIAGELSLAAELLDVPVVAVTGTNGKTTVTSLVGELLKADGKKVFVGGNIGTPILDFLLSEKKVDAAVLELSSFQLENCGNFRPDVGILLNITPDHLDRHSSMENYRQAKLNLFVNQEKGDTALVYGDDPFCAEAQVPGKADKLLFGCKQDVDIVLKGSSVELLFEEQIETYSLKDTALDSKIGILNSAPAIYAARKLGCSKENIIKGLTSFVIGEHRLEHVRMLDGVDYYNDSKATNTGAVIRGLEQFERVVLIIGGRDKGDDYTLLRPMVAERVKFLIFIGEAAPLITEALADLAVPFVEAKTMNEAVAVARKMATSGETVLLAPACASFDMFKNYQDRGEQFRDAVKQL